MAFFDPVARMFDEACGEDGYIEANELKSSLGFCVRRGFCAPNVKPALLVLKSITMKVPARMTLCVKVLRADEEESGVESTASAKCGTLSIRLPSGTARPPLLRLQLKNEIRCVGEVDVRLYPNVAPKEVAANVLAAFAIVPGGVEDHQQRRMSTAHPSTPKQTGQVSASFVGEEPAAISFSFTLNEVEPSRDEVDWAEVWAALPADWDSDGRLDVDEFQTWMDTLTKVVTPARQPEVAKALGRSLKQVAHRGKEKPTGVAAEPSQGSRRPSINAKEAAAAAAAFAASLPARTLARRPSVSKDYTAKDAALATATGGPPAAAQSSSSRGSERKPKEGLLVSLHGAARRMSL